MQLNQYSNPDVYSPLEDAIASLLLVVIASLTMVGVWGFITLTFTAADLGLIAFLMTVCAAFFFATVVRIPSRETIAAFLVFSLFGLFIGALITTEPIRWPFVGSLERRVAGLAAILLVLVLFHHFGISTTAGYPPTIIRLTQRAANGFKRLSQYIRRKFL